MGSDVHHFPAWGLRVRTVTMGGGAVERYWLVRSPHGSNASPCSGSFSCSSPGSSNLHTGTRRALRLTVGLAGATLPATLIVPIPPDGILAHRAELTGKQARGE